MNWIREAVESYKAKIELGLELYSDFDKAIKYANDNSTAGAKAKMIAISEMRGN